MAADIWRTDPKRQAKQQMQGTAALTEKELAGYRQWLAELAEEALEPGGDPTFCDEEVYPYFSLRTSCGRQVYDSYSDEELLEVLVRMMDHHGHRVNGHDIYCIYKDYLRKRFGTMPDAISKARGRLKLRKNQMRWPPDWPERVSLQVLLDAPRNRTRSPSQEDIAFLNRLCETARRTGYPPELTKDDRRRLDHMKLGGCKFILETMGIPCLGRIARKHMIQYWRTERRKLSEHSAEEEKKHE